MTRFKTFLLATLVLSAAMFAISLNSAGHAIAQALAQDVRVVNKGNESVPVLNPPNLPLTTRIVNKESEPVFTKSTDSPASHFVVGTSYGLNLGAQGGQQCTVAEIQGTWIKCHYPPVRGRPGLFLNWVNAAHIISTNK
jgi:hypothetical protein